MPVFLFVEVLYTIPMRKILYLSIFLVVFLVGLAFAVLNSQSIAINYYFDKIDVQLSLALILAMLLGAIVGVIASLLLMLQLRREVARLRRGLQLAEKQAAISRSLHNKSD